MLFRSTVAVSLTLFGVSLLVRAQVSTMQDFWYDKVEVSIFLCAKGSDAASCVSGEVTRAQREQIRADLESLRPLVEGVYYESKAEAYERFREQFANSPIVENVTEEALPESFRVKLSDPEQYEVVASAFAGRPGIEQVNDQRQILDKFFQLLNGLQAGALLIAVIMLIVTLLLIVNTMRVAAFSLRRETGIMRLVGASNFYIQLPFLLEAAVAAAFQGFELGKLLLPVPQNMGFDPAELAHLADREVTLAGDRRQVCIIPGFQHTPLLAPSDRKSTRLNSSHSSVSRMPSSA